MKDDLIFEGAFYGQHIKDKNLIYSGGDLTVIDCKLENCTFELTGNAKIGANFIKRMFDSGFKCAVMKMFLTDDEYEIVKNALDWHGKDGN